MDIKTHTIIVLTGTHKGNFLDTFTVAINKLESKPDFILLPNNVQAADTFSSYPKNTHFIILDVDNYENIKNDVEYIADKNNYNIQYVYASDQKIEISFIDWLEYTNKLIPSNYDWITIGDVHGCFNEMMILLTEYYGFEYDDTTRELIDTEKTKNLGIIFVGDLVDKSSDEDLEETIRFIHKNMGVWGDRLQLILGNHEEMVWKWVTNDTSLEITPERLDQKVKYYNTSILLENNEELKKMFLEIYNKMKGWVKTKDFIVTHAPCEIKYLEKMDSDSLKKQYKCLSRSKNRDKTNDEITPYLMIEANEAHPKHIFGHMGQTNVREFKNKICIDTGCVYGGELTGYRHSNGEIKIVKSLSSKEAKNDFSNNLFNLDNK